MLVNRLGGRWSHGADVGEFAPCQVVYRNGMHLEIISPGSVRDGFMRRFEDDDELLRTFRPSAPEGFPTDPPEPTDIAWIGLTAASVEFAAALFGEVLGGDVAGSGSGWRMFTWGPQRRLRVWRVAASVGAAATWGSSRR